MKKIISLLLLIICAPTVFAKVPDIVAIVNDQPITKYDFELRKKLIVVLSNVDTSNLSVNNSVNNATINMLIEEELLQQYAADVGIKIKEEQKKHAISMIEQQNHMPSGAMIEYLKSNGVSIESFKKQITGELIKYNIVNSISGSTTVTPSEIDIAIINSLRTDFDIQAWIFTAKENNNHAYKEMQNLRKKITNCDNVNEKLFEKFAFGDKYTGKLRQLHATTESIIHDTDAGDRSSLYQEDGKLKMVLVCKKDADVSTENLDKLKAFLSNKKMTQKATKLFKSLRNKANIKIMLPS